MSIPLQTPLQTRNTECVSAFPPQKNRSSKGRLSSRPLDISAVASEKEIASVPGSVCLDEKKRKPKTANVHLTRGLPRPPTTHPFLSAVECATFTLKWKRRRPPCSPLARFSVALPVSTLAFAGSPRLSRIAFDWWPESSRGEPSARGLSLPDLPRLKRPFSPWIPSRSTAHLPPHQGDLP